MTEKRSSTRVSVLSKSMRKVDDTTRKEVHDKRLRALEADNYNEETTVENAVEDNYSSEENEEEPVSKRRKKTKPAQKSKARTRKIRDLDRIIDGQRQLLLQSKQKGEKTSPCYVSVAASPSIRPPRKFCSVCGYWGTYSCTRCGMRFCSLKCNNNHKETRCLKFSVI